MDEKELAKFKKDRVKKLQNLYSDETASRNRYDRTPVSRAQDYETAADVREALEDAITNQDQVIETSRKLLATNPIYAAVINYMSNMFMWRYTVTPHKLYTKSKAKARSIPKEADFNMMYGLMLEVVDGVGIETKFPILLTKLFTEASVFFTTICDEESYAIDTLTLPAKYCRKIGETQFGTAIIEFDFSYFNDLGLNAEKLKDYLKSFPSEFQKGYRKYLDDSANSRWIPLDPHFSSGIQLNEFNIPTYLYILGGIKDYEQYQDNELERNENLLKYLVVQTIPHYEDKLIFEVDEVKALHQSLKRIIDTGNRSRLVTTYGDIHVEKIAESDKTANEVLEKAFKAVFNNAGFNSGIFTSESVEALKMSLIRDKGIVWRYVTSLLSFYNIAINNWFDFKDYQADIDILPISPYTYDDDIRVYKENATLGVGKLAYIVASGIKQKNVLDTLQLESFLHLEKITPMQTSYTQTAEDRKAEESSKDSTGNKTDLEPSDNKQPVEQKDEDIKEDEDEKTTN